MNSADQGVNYLDSAFKRRWNYEYLKINYNDIADNAYILYNSYNYTYKSFIKELNRHLQEDKAIDEDRLIGPWYIDSTGSDLNIFEADKPHDDKRAIKQQLPAINKLLLYLWDDLFRHKHGSNDEFTEKSLDKLIEEFPKKNVLKLEISNLKSIDETENVDNEN